MPTNAKIERATPRASPLQEVDGGFRLAGRGVRSNVRKSVRTSVRPHIIE
jgi:hypothetical protein